MTIKAELATVPGACGVGVYEGFGIHYGVDIATAPHEGGAGYVMAGFIYKDKLCDEAFEILNKRFKLVFKSRVRKNKNSGNKFYFAVFDTYGICKSGFDAVDKFHERNW